MVRRRGLVCVTPQQETRTRDTLRGPQTTFNARSTLVSWRLFRRAASCGLCESSPSLLSSVPSLPVVLRRLSFPPETGHSLTIRISTLDAEGRLVLADALVEASSETPDILIDCATLTGRIRGRRKQGF